MKIDPETEISKIIDVNQKITENILIFVAYFKSIMYTPVFDSYRRKK